MQTEQELITQLASAKGETRREILLALCDFRSELADAVWQKRLCQPITQYLPYLCFSRSDAVSDFAAQRLEHAVNKLIIFRNRCSAELTEEAWAALNISVFKQSPRMIEVLRKIGKHFHELEQAALDLRVLHCSETLPPFLRRGVNLAFPHRSEVGFLRLLNDLLICTCVRAGREFSETLTALAEEFPEAFGIAGFFAQFVTDQDAAFERYAFPNRLSQILPTLSALEWQDGVCVLYSPLWYYGVRNRIWQMKLTLPCLSDRWIVWLSRAYCFADESQRGELSRLLFQFTWMEEHHAQLREFFFHAALEDTSETNLIGLMRCGGYPQTETLIRGICDMICRGKNNYHALFAVSELLDLKKPEKLRLLARAREYIESCHHRESWYAQRNQFLHAVSQYRNGNTTELK